MEKHLYISLPKLKSSEIQDIHFKINLLLFSVDDQTEKVDDKKNYQILGKNSHDIKGFYIKLVTQRVAKQV